MWSLSYSPFSLSWFNLFFIFYNKNILIHIDAFLFNVLFYYDFIFNLFYLHKLPLIIKISVSFLCLSWFRFYFWWFIISLVYRIFKVLNHFFIILIYTIWIRHKKILNWLRLIFIQSNGLQICIKILKSWVFEVFTIKLINT